jgi:ribosome-associated protein
VSDAARDVPIAEGGIRLGQFLKLSGAIGTGAEAKLLLGEGGVRVNGEPEARRGRQLAVGDVVEVDGERLRVAAR